MKNIIIIFLVLSAFGACKEHNKHKIANIPEASGIDICKDNGKICSW